MRCYRPDIQVADDFGPVTSLPEKFGGDPWGFHGPWPICRDCGEPMSFVAQLHHHPDRLDLGQTGRQLFVFQCEHHGGACETWSPHAGANACIVLDAADLSCTPRQTPEGTPVLNEVFVRDWLVDEDGVADADYPAFFTSRFYELSEETLDRPRWSTQLAGTPRWLQDVEPVVADRPEWRFLGQLDESHSFLSEPQRLPTWVVPDEERWERRTHSAPGPNFGAGGIAYLFIRDQSASPTVIVFWQCV